MKKSAWKWVFAGMFFHDAGDRQQHEAVVGVDRLAHGIFVPEIPAGRILADDHGVRRFERACRISLDQRQREKVEERVFRPVDRSFVENAVLVLHDPGAGRGVHTQQVLYFGEIGPQRGPHAAGRLGVVVEHDPVDPASLIVVPVITQFVPDVQEDQDGAGQCRPPGPGR